MEHNIFLSGTKFRIYPYVLNISIFPNYSKYPQHTKHIAHPFFGVSLKSTSGNILSQIQERTTPYSPLCPFAPPQAFLLNTSPVRDARYVLFPGLEARKTMLFLKELFGFRGAKQDVTRSYSTGQGPVTGLRGHYTRGIRGLVGALPRIIIKFRIEFGSHRHPAPLFH